MSGNNYVLLFLWEPKFYLKFLKQNGRQFRLSYVRGPADTVEVTGVTCTYGTGLRQDMSLESSVGTCLGCFDIEMWTNVWKSANMRIARFAQFGHLTRKCKMFIKNKAKIASIVGSIT